jgi:hypothetical protein
LPKIEEKTKNKEKRLEEKEKIDAETQRSLAVAKMKSAHKAIEDVEKLRKRSALLSVRQRLETCARKLEGLSRLLKSPPFGEEPIHDKNLRKSILFEGKIYESILYDFQKTLDITDQEMEKLFPKIDMVDESNFSISSCFTQMVSQMEQMRIYCERYHV